MAASAVFCFAVLGLLYALHVATDASREAQRQKMARLELQSRLTRLSMPPYQNFSDKATVEGIQFSEEVHREEVKGEDLSLLQGYWRIRVAAEWLDGTEKRRWEASHLVWSP